MSTTLLLSIVVVAVLGGAVVLYNRLVRLRNNVDNGWSQIDVQLQRRTDLIPNLVNTVKGYAAHERETLEAVIAARNSLSSAGTPAEAGAADNILSGALRQIFALSEAYPDLKANTNFLQLQSELTETEGRVAYSRQYYNDAVTRYNIATQVFPSSIVASLGRFSERELFEAPLEARIVPTIEF